MSCSNSTYFINTLSPAEYPGNILSSELIHKYKDIFIHIIIYNKFQESDIKLNKVWPMGLALDFIADYERKLDSKPALASNMHQFLNLSLALPADSPQVCYFIKLFVCFTFLMVSAGE